jgi:hypothetical protein
VEKLVPENSKKDEIKHLAEKYQKHGRLFLLATIFCALITLFSFLTFYILSDPLFLLTAPLSLIVLLILPLLAVGYYAQADYYKSLIDGKDREKKWKHLAIVGIGASLIFILLAIAFPSLGNLAFIFFIAAIIGMLFIAIGQSVYMSEKREYEFKNELYYKNKIKNISELDKVSNLLAAEAFTVIISIMLFFGLSSYNFLAGLAIIPIALLASFHMIRTYTKYSPMFREIRRIQKEKIVKSYIKDMKKESPRMKGIKRKINAISIAINYLLWTSLLYEIKAQPLPVNCCNAIPTDAWLFFLVFFFNTLVIGATNRRPNLPASIGVVILVTYTAIFFEFSSALLVGCMCYCYDPTVITNTYLQVSVMFIMDTAVKSPIATGLIDERMKKIAKKIGIEDF